MHNTTGKEPGSWKLVHKILILGVISAFSIFCLILLPSFQYFSNLITYSIQRFSHIIRYPIIFPLLESVLFSGSQACAQVLGPAEDVQLLYKVQRGELGGKGSRTVCLLGISNSMHLSRRLKRVFSMCDTPPATKSPHWELGRTLRVPLFIFVQR